MRFLANENFAAVVALQAAGHDIVWVRPAEPGATDPDVFALAAPEERIPLTFAKDFGELTRASNRPLTCAVCCCGFRSRPRGVGRIGPAASLLSSLAAPYAPLGRWWVKLPPSTCISTVGIRTGATGRTSFQSVFSRTMTSIAAMRMPSGAGMSIFGSHSSGMSDSSSESSR